MREIRPILARYYGEDLAERVIRDAEPIHDRFLAETPSIGGRKPPMNKDMDLALPFFALYEVSGERWQGTSSAKCRIRSSLPDTEGSAGGSIGRS